MKLEQLQESIRGETNRNRCKPRIRDVYTVVDEATKLLPLLGSYANTLAAGPADTPATGARHLAASAGNS